MSEQNKIFTNLLVHFVVLKSKIGNPKILLQHLSERANFARNIVRKTDRIDSMTFRPVLATEAAIRGVL